MNRIKKIFYYIFTLLIILVISAIGISYRLIKTTCSRALVSPEKQARIVQKRNILINELGGHPVSFSTSDGIKISGLLFRRPNAKKVIIAAHGYFSNKEGMMHVVDMFPNDHVLLFDFRGHGQSSGNIISIGYHERKDIAAAVEFLKVNGFLNSLPLLGIGNSMGSATLIGSAAQDVPFDVLVLDSSFARLEKQLDDTFTARTGLPKKPFLPIAMQLCYYMGGGIVQDVNPVQWIKQVNIPVLIIHSDVDELVPIFDAKTMYNNANKPKELWIVSDAKHGDAWKLDYEHYKNTITNFIAHYL